MAKHFIVVKDGDDIKQYEAKTKYIGGTQDIDFDLDCLICDVCGEIAYGITAEHCGSKDKAHICFDCIDKQKEQL